MPRAVWALGLVSLFMDLSSEMIHGLLPAFIAVELGMGTVALGLIEGSAEAIASFMKIGSGALSDRSGRRKGLALFGYGLAAASKPLFALATTLTPLVLARCIDRIGKGIRGAPRDALVADVTPPELRGAAYGLRQALDSVGAVLGPVVAIALMIATGDRFSHVFWIAVVPALFAVLVLALGVREAATDRTPTKKPSFTLADIPALGRPAWRVVALASLLALARFTEAFLVLALLDRGLPVAWSPVALVAMAAVYAALSYPAGRLADRVDRPRLLAAGAALLCVGYLALALGQGLVLGFVGIALYGAHMAVTQGLLSAWLSSVAPTHRRATAFGLMHFGSGVGTLAGGALAGIVWATSDAHAAFATGAGLALLVVVAAWVGGARGSAAA